MLINSKIPLVFGIPQCGFFGFLKGRRVFVAELRPGLEGIKTVADQAKAEGADPVVVCDNMLAFCMERGLVSAVHIFYGSLRTKKAICRTGSLIAAICGQEHKIPVYLHKGTARRVRPSSLLKIDGRTVTSRGIKTYAPLAEEVPLSLVSKIQ
ncbi:MAG: hypothetical protein V1863_03880 [Candidatus Omnitrophota bacterium]